MMLFNQAWISERNFILDLEEVPDEFQDIASYLQRPLQDKEIRKKLALEAEAEMVFAMQEARVKQAEQRQQEAEQREQAFKRMIIKKLYETQIPLEEIARMTDLSVEQVKEVLIDK